MRTAFPILLFVAIMLLAEPWGNFPLNDDWIYAHVAHAFSITGRMRFDLGFAPSLVGQVLLVAPLIKFFGFSHTLLRGLSMLVGTLTLLGVARILTLLGSPPWQRSLALFCLAVNPFFLYFSTTFMTEIYGSFVLIWASALWLGARAREIEGDRPLGWGSTLLCGALFGIAFWFRQFFALGFPAWMASYLLASLYRKRSREIKDSLKPLIAATMVYGAIISGFFAWASSSGNLVREFSGPLADVFRFDGRAALLHLAIILPCITLFCLPILLVSSFSRLREITRPWLWAGIIAYLAFGACQSWILSHLEMWVPPRFFFQRYFNHGFPYYGNAVQSFGIGPLTLTDSYLNPDRVPIRIPRQAWDLVYLAAYLGQVGWVLLLAKLGVKAARPPEERIAPLSLELGAFGFIFGASTWALTLQAYKFSFFDRYTFPIFLGAFFATVAAGKAVREVKPPGSAAVAAGAVLLVEAAFSLAGLHDEFQWQGARWKIFQKAQDPIYNLLPHETNLAAEIDGGYEINGWTAYEPVGNPLVSCPDLQYWSYCHKSLYSINFLPEGCRHKVLTEPVRLYLVSSPEIVLCKNF